MLRAMQTLSILFFAPDAQHQRIFLTSEVFTVRKKERAGSYGLCLNCFLIIKVCSPNLHH